MRIALSRLYMAYKIQIGIASPIIFNGSPYSLHKNLKAPTIPIHKHTGLLRIIIIICWFSEPHNESTV